MPARLPGRVLEAIRRDVSAPAPLLLLPLRLEYRVVESGVPIRIAGNVANVLRGSADVTLDPAPAAPGRRRRGRSQPFRLDPISAIFRTTRQIWFRWYPDEDFTLHGVAPATETELDALARFDAASAGAAWHALDDPAVVSAWQALSREIAPERALHLLRHRGQPGDPNHLDVIGRIPLLPEKVALFALGADGAPTLLGEGQPIDPALRYSMANLQTGGWHTDFDAALAAGMGLRLTSSDAVTRALAASWIVAVGLSTASGAEAMSALLDDAIANGQFAFLRQDTPTNNTPNEPTPYQSPRADLLAFLRAAVDAERGVLASPLTQSAELFAEALGVDVSHVASAPLSGDLAFEDARAMLRVVGPALIDTAVDRTAALNGIDEDTVIDFFEEVIAARGPLPAVRFGKNPYGVLPVVALETLTSLASDTKPQSQIEAFVRDFAATVQATAGAAADATVPVLLPGDPDAETKLEAILKAYPVSRRLEVATVGMPDVKGLGCPYVSSTAHPVAEYLARLARDPIKSLPDPTADDPGLPLLYRLARLSLSKQTLIIGVLDAPTLAGVVLNTRVHFTPAEKIKFDQAAAPVTKHSLAALATQPIAGVGRRAPVLRKASGRLLAALQRLEAIAREPDGVARIETLLMETIDLFQHRIDAWATGLAYRRLVKRRRAGRAGLVGGYWGLLGQLRVESVTGLSDGFLQAPSQHQAVTAAVLRAAHLRHREDGAFAIGLSSARVRRGLHLLEMLQAGLSPGEALGYIGERSLHDRHQDVLIFRLRELFPLKDPRDDAALETRLFDGLLFVNAEIQALVPAADAPPLAALQTHLGEHLDALSDIVLAEATHLRAMGRADAANAWMQVLSGETIPGWPSVLRTRRTSHGSTHRVVVLIKPEDPDPAATPRAIAEPALAALATSLLSGFDRAIARVTVTGEARGVSSTFDLTLGGDLGLTPIDLVVGGESEVILRARHRLLELWRTNVAVQADLGTLPERDVTTFVNQTRPVTVDLDVGRPSARALLTRASELRRAVAQGRPLEPSDLSAAADPAEPLTDEAEREALSGSIAALVTRASLLGGRIAARLMALRAAIGPLVAAARNHRRLVDDLADSATLSQAQSEVVALRRPLEMELLAASRFAEPAALRPLTIFELTSDPDAAERALVGITERLAAKAAGLTSALSGDALNASGARARRDALVGAIRAALDGDALPVLPPQPRTAATTPLLQPSPGRVTPALAEWAPVRSKLARIADLFGPLPWRAHSSAEAATGADAEDADERDDEAVAPRAHLFGTFVATASPAAAARLTGFVADEWAEQRPSRKQQTGLAINYDSPQSEPPHALLLCEPSGPAAPAWTPAAAAALAAEVIGLMKVRALTAQDRPLSGPLFPFANQVPFKQVPGSASAPRIPGQRLKLFPGLTQNLTDAAFVVDGSVTDVGVAGTGLAEIDGFGKTKE